MNCLYSKLSIPKLGNAQIRPIVRCLLATQKFNKKMVRFRIDLLTLQVIIWSGWVTCRRTCRRTMSIWHCERSSDRWSTKINNDLTPISSSFAIFLLTKIFFKKKPRRWCSQKFWLFSFQILTLINLERIWNDLVWKGVIHSMYNKAQWTMFTN